MQLALLILQLSDFIKINTCSLAQQCIRTQSSKFTVLYSLFQLVCVS